MNRSGGNVHSQTSLMVTAVCSNVEFKCISCPRVFCTQPAGGRCLYWQCVLLTGLCDKCCHVTSACVPWTVQSSQVGRNRLPPVGPRPRPVEVMFHPFVSPCVSLMRKCLAAARVFTRVTPATARVLACRRVALVQPTS